jgi:hypothetical protein
MKTQVLKGSKEEIAEGLARIDGKMCEAIVFIEEPSDALPEPGEDIFAEMEPFVVHVGDADCSREAIYNRLEGE